MAEVSDPRAGFTLLEMVVVLAITALVFSVGAIGLSVLKGRVTPTRTAGEIAQAMSAARIDARHTGSEAVVTVDLEAKQVTREGGVGVITIPDEYRLRVVVGRETVADDRSIPVRFLPDGTSSGAEIDITSPEGAFARVEVNWLTGLAMVSDAKR